MSDPESSGSSDEEYVPKEDSVSEEDDLISDPESDSGLYKKEVLKNDNVPELSKEEKEKQEKDLWSNFLTDVDQEKKNKLKGAIAKESESQIMVTDKGTSVTNTPVRQVLDRPCVTKSLSFVGLKGSLKRGGGCGVLSLDNILAKKPKLTTLEKSKLDWEAFVREEGIKEDLKNHNKGKQGYLERKAFEARTEMKQYEIERDLRARTQPKK